MMAFTPVPAAGEVPVLEDDSRSPWTPLLQHSCTFPPEIFMEVMLNLIRNPNINSTHLFRADISLDVPFGDYTEDPSSTSPRILHFKDFVTKTVMVRTLVPRNPKVDKPLDQTCLIGERVLDGEIQSLVVYIPHISTPTEAPFYHPAVRGIAFFHSFQSASQQGTVAIHYSFFDTLPHNKKLERTAHHILASVFKHGQGKAAGYVKRVQHDVVLPQAVVQNTYARLKARYAKAMIGAWVETTDPGKHVFEDLGIAAFLIELWNVMYVGRKFPGFVDIGCGNGLLVHILLEEGYVGYGFDARARKSWSIYPEGTKHNLHEMVLIPSLIQSSKNGDGQTGGAQICLKRSTPGNIESQSDDPKQDSAHPNTASQIHSGIFNPGTFIISNHADELTPWTPILATLSSSPFMMIPCCSHALNGARFRAPPSKLAGASTSAYASLVAWVSNIAKECGFSVEIEMLRIPSTRNTAIIGRGQLLLEGLTESNEIRMMKLVEKYGGACGWEENALKLVKASVRGH